MKIIVSHDVDHLYWSEHISDTFILKFYYNSLKWYIKGYIDYEEFKYKIKRIFRKELHRLNELVSFNNSFGVKSNFFIGLANGKGLNYSLRNAIVFISKLEELNQEVGIHGISYNDKNLMTKEFELLKQNLKSDIYGIRMHYLRNDSSTLNILNEIGYNFDSSEYGLKPEYKIGNMIEYPISIMESYLWRDAGFNYDKMMDYTKKRVDEAVQKKLNYFIINFHDLHFDNSYLIFKKWYEKTIEYLKNNSFEFTNFNMETKRRLME